MVELPQKATYWSILLEDEFGNITYGVPVSLNSRWEEVFEEIIDPGGHTVVSKTKVFTSIEVAVKGFLFKGESVVTDPTTLVDAQEIIAFSSITDLRNVDKLYTARL